MNPNAVSHQNPNSTREGATCGMEIKHIMKSFWRAFRITNPNIEFKADPDCCPNNPESCSPQSMGFQTGCCVSGTSIALCTLPFNPVTNAALAIAIGIGQAPITSACIHGCQGVAQRGPTPDPPENTPPIALNTMESNRISKMALESYKHYIQNNQT